MHSPLIHTRTRFPLARLLVAGIVAYSTFGWSVTAYAEGGIGEDVGLDFYQKIDEGTLTLKKQFLNKRLEGSANRINEMIGKKCISGTTPSYCLQDGYDFTESEMSLIEANEVGPLIAHFKEEFRKPAASAESISNRIMPAMKDFFGTARAETKNQIERMQSIGTIGLYSDGNTENSSFDLMEDIKQIHNVIFAADIEYKGTANMGSASVLDLLARKGTSSAYGVGGPTSTNNTNMASTNNTWTPPPGDNFTDNPTGPNSTLPQPVSTQCQTGSTFTNLDEFAKSDLAYQSSYGASHHSSIGGPNAEYRYDGLGGIPRLGPNNGFAGPMGSGMGGWNLFDAGPCTSFFCIKVEFIMYSSMLFWGGGKTDSIEWILDKHLAIANEIAPLSGIQSKMTKNFFECEVCKYVNLPSLAHLWVIVTKKPAPILNLKKPTYDAAAAKQEGAEEMLVYSLEKFGFDPKRENSLETPFDDKRVQELAGLTSEKLKTSYPTQSYVSPKKRADFDSVRRSEARSQYYDSFNGDVMEMSEFSRQFLAYIDLSLGIFDRMNRCITSDPQSKDSCN